MNVVITMAGQGSRFKEAGYNQPKYTIDAHGRPLFEWAMLSLKDFFDCKFFFLVRKQDNCHRFVKQMCALLGISRYSIMDVDSTTDGQATTATFAKRMWDRADSLLIYNIDTFVKPYSIAKKDIKGDGFVPCFLGEGDHWSFVEADSSLKGIAVKEKERISPYCTLGAYYFKTADLFERLYEEYFGQNPEGERYIAPMYNLLIQKGMELYISVVQKEDVHVLGTPEELEFFKANYEDTEEFEEY